MEFQNELLVEKININNQKFFKYVIEDKICMYVFQAMWKSINAIGIGLMNVSLIVICCHSVMSGWTKTLKIMKINSTYYKKKRACFNESIYFQFFASERVFENIGTVSRCKGIELLSTFAIITYFCSRNSTLWILVLILKSEDIIIYQLLTALHKSQARGSKNQNVFTLILIFLSDLVWLTRYA